MAKQFDCAAAQRKRFQVVGSTKKTEAALIELLPDETTGSDASNRPSADQWIYVLSGKGVAVVAGESFVLSEGSLLLIEPGEAHKISASDGDPLRALSFSSPVIQ